MKKVTVVYDSFACVADIEPAEHSLSLILEDATADQLKDVPLPTNSESGLEANRLCYAIRWLERLAGGLCTRARSRLFPLRRRTCDASAQFSPSSAL